MTKLSKAADEIVGAVVELIYDSAHDEGLSPDDFV